MNDKPRGIKFICYYNLVLSAIFIFGSLILFIFSRVASLESNPVTTQNLFMFVLLSLFYGFSAYKFLQRNNVIIILKKLKSSRSPCTRHLDTKAYAPIATRGQELYGRCMTISS